MKLIINIPEDMFKSITNWKKPNDDTRLTLWLLLKNGIPLDKIRDEIETKYGQCDICEYFENYDYEENDISEYRPIGNIADILQIIDKYKAERSDKE